MLLKYCFKKENFEKNPQTTKRHEKYPACKELSNIVIQKLYRAKMKTSGGYSIDWSLNTQKRSQNAEKVSHIKGRLLDQTMNLINCAPFQNGTSLKGKNSTPEGANSFLYE